jgi:hypothetical protein
MVSLRGISRLTAAVTALLLIYGITYAMEGMTTRLPETSLHEFAFRTLWMFPWMLLFCSGLEDLGKATRQAWLFWAGLAVGIALLCYLERYTADSFLTKIALPMVATGGGSMPHFIRRLSFVYIVCSFAVGICGLAVFYFEGSAFLSGSSFATRTIAFLIVAFGISSIATASLSANFLRGAVLR